jgi:hypothetical protein
VRNCSSEGPLARLASRVNSRDRPRGWRSLYRSCRPGRYAANYVPAALRRLRKHARSQGPSLHRHYPASAVLRPCPTPAEAAALGDVEAATLAYDGSPPITRVTLPARCAHYPGESNGCLCRLLPRSHGLHRISAGSASALWISRPAQASLALRPAGSLDRQKRPLSRGFGPSGYPSKPLVSYQINRQLSGRNPPPLVTRAFGAHQNEANLLRVR